MSIGCSISNAVGSDAAGHGGSARGKYGCRRLLYDAFESDQLAQLGDVLRFALSAENGSPGLRSVVSGFSVAESLLDIELSFARMSSLCDLGLLDLHDGMASSPFRAQLIEGLVVLSDPDVAEAEQDPLYLDPLWEAPWLARCMVRGQAGSGLDMGCGCGVLSLVLASYCERVIGVDVNPRALELARFNAALNRIKNVSFVASDLFQNVPTRQFDRIVFNSPTGEEEENNRSLLEAGEGILERFFSSTGKYLSASGFCQVNLAMNDYANSLFSERLKNWIGPAHQQMQWVVLVSESKERTPTHLWRRGWLTMRPGPHYQDEINWNYPALYPGVEPMEVTRVLVRILENGEALSRRTLDAGCELAWAPGVAREGQHLGLWGIPLVNAPATLEVKNPRENERVVPDPANPWFIECLRHGLLSRRHSRGNEVEQ